MTVNERWATSWQRHGAGQKSPHRSHADAPIPLTGSNLRWRSCVTPEGWSSTWTFRWRRSWFAQQCSSGRSAGGRPACDLSHRGLSALRRLCATRCAKRFPTPPRVEGDLSGAWLWGWLWPLDLLSKIASCLRFLNKRQSRFLLKTSSVIVLTGARRRWGFGPCALSPCVVVASPSALRFHSSAVSYRALRDAPVTWLPAAQRFSGQFLSSRRSTRRFRRCHRWSPPPAAAPRISPRALRPFQPGRQSVGGLGGDFFKPFGQFTGQGHWRSPSGGPAPCASS